MTFFHNKIVLQCTVFESQAASPGDLIQVILFEIDCLIFYTYLHELFCQFISWTNWVNSDKFMDKLLNIMSSYGWYEKVYGNLIIINLYKKIHTGVTIKFLAFSLSIKSMHSCPETSNPSFHLKMVFTEKKRAQNTKFDVDLTVQVVCT